MTSNRTVAQVPCAAVHDPHLPKQNLLSEDLRIAIETDISQAAQILLLLGYILQNTFVSKSGSALPKRYRVSDLIEVWTLDREYMNYCDRCDQRLT